MLEKKRYWIKHLDELVKYPRRNHSWNGKKGDNFFKRMELWIKTKNSKQCKSFDQRMKRKYFCSKTPPVDIIEATFSNLSHLNDKTVQNKLSFLELLLTSNTNELIQKSIQEN